MESRTVQSVLISMSKIQQNRGQVEGLPANPRVIKDGKFDLLKKSIEDNPEMIGYRELLVYPHNGKYVIIGGNMRYAALKELGVKDVPCKVISNDATIDQLKAYVIKDNAGYGEWDFGMLEAEWNDVDVADWGVDIPTYEEADNGTYADRDEEEIERKRSEFKERMDAGELSDDDPEYQEFLEKFEAKKTTDDCYTPTIVYEAIAEWVAVKYNLNRGKFIRPFYPGGDYANEKYDDGCIVVDNPPFSIMAEILKFYKERGIKFFLFAPHLTLFSSSSSYCSALPVGVSVTYENGAVVNTSFLTNLEPETIRFRSEPSLYSVIKAANDENMKSMRKQLPKYSYDHHIVTTPFLSALSRLGIEFSVDVDESEPISQLESQKESGKAIFGKGYIVSDRVFAEREKAEREKAEREKAEREKAEREKAERWELHDKELKIVEKLNENARRKADGEE